MSRSVEEVYKLTESTYKVSTAGNTTGVPTHRRGGKKKGRKKSKYPGDTEWNRSQQLSCNSR